MTTQEIFFEAMTQFGFDITPLKHAESGNTPAVWKKIDNIKESFLRFHIDSFNTFLAYGWKIDVPIEQEEYTRSNEFVLYNKELKVREKGDLFFLLGKMTQSMFDGFDVNQVHNGNCETPIYDIELVYPFEDNTTYRLYLPNSINDNVSNAEFNNFIVVTMRKDIVHGLVDGLDDSFDEAIIKEDKFSTIEDAFSFIACEK